MDGWWEGTLRGKTGMFPDNFVKVVEKSSASTAPVEPITSKSEPGNNSVTLRSNPSKSARRLKALFSYSPEQEDELRLDVGDVVEFITEVEEGWWRGKLKGRIGIFPSNFVSDFEPTSNGKIDPEPKQDDFSSRMKIPKEDPDPDVPPPPPVSAPPTEVEPAPELPPKPVRELARCFYPYQAQNEDELTLVEGDIVTIISKNCEDEGWWRGEIKGKNGLFPDNFVKIIPANEVANQSKTPSITSHTTKISPQGRNLVGVKPIGNGGGDPVAAEKTNGSSVVDGIGSSKIQEKEKESVSSKVAMFSKHPISFNPTIKPSTTPTSPVSSSSLSPLSMPTVLRSHPERKDSHGMKNGKKTEDMGEFNAIERGEKLNHLTVGRAKAPKRRPPSQLMARDADSDESLLNGSLQSEDSMDSPPLHNSTALNTSTASTTSIGGTPTTPTFETSSASGSFLTQTKDNDSSSVSPASGNASAAKPKKLLPWMAELKQTQDKKRGITSPGVAPNNSSVSSTGSPSTGGSPASLPPVSPAIGSSGIVTKEKEPVPTPPPAAPAVLTKAPPLPAKPSSLSTSSIVDKSAGISPSTASAPTTVPSVANRGFGRKPSTANPIQSITTNHVNSSIAHDGNAGGDTKQFVPYEEYAKLRDRVSILETELETVRRQVKVLLDRELNHGHMV